MWSKISIFESDKQHMRPSNEQTIKEAINDFLESSKMKSRLTEVNIINKWPELVGPLIAKGTDKIYFQQGKLFLYINSAALRNELLYQRSKIMALVNHEAGEQLVEDVIIR